MSKSPLFKVICTLPNASLLISGVAFAPVKEREGAVASDLVDEDTANLFKNIPGYSIVEVAEQSPPPPPPAPPAPPATPAPEPAPAAAPKAAATK